MIIKMPLGSHHYNKRVRVVVDGSSYLNTGYMQLLQLFPSIYDIGLVLTRQERCYVGQLCTLQNREGHNIEPY